MGDEYTPEGLEPHCRPSILGFGMPPSPSGLNGGFGAIAPSNDRFQVRGSTISAGRTRPACRRSQSGPVCRRSLCRKADLRGREAAVNEIPNFATGAATAVSGAEQPFVRNLDELQEHGGSRTLHRCREHQLEARGMQSVSASLEIPALTLLRMENTHIEVTVVAQSRT